MLLDKPFVCSKAQDLTGGSAAASTNQAKMTAIEWAGLTDLWAVIDTETIATGDGSDTFKFELRVATSTALTTYLQVISVDFTGVTDARIATAGKHIMNCNVGEMVRNTMKALRDAQSLTDSDYIYVGFYYTPSAGSTLSVNAALSPSRPHSDYFTQVVDSNVGIPTQVSAGS